MSVVSMFKGKGPSGFGYGSTAEQVTEGIDLSGKNVLVTGCNSGLGLETARVMALRGARVIGCARTADKATSALADLEGEHVGVACELSEPASVRAAVETVHALDVPLHAIVCNAGIMALPKLEQKHGIELQMFTNHVGHFILVTGLLERLADDGRVVMLSSSAHTMAPKEGIELDNLSGERGYTAWGRYGQSKLANILFARSIARRLEGTGKTANAVHPGVINTNLSRHMNPGIRLVFGAFAPLALKSVGQGAATQCYVAVHPDTASLRGAYFADCNVSEGSAASRDDALADKLWGATEEIVARLP